MFLVLAHYDDRLAARVHERLRARHGAARARLLTADDLALGTRWALRQDGARVDVTMRLADDTHVRSTEIDAVFNRLRFAAAPHFAAAPDADRDYALMETHAFLLSWLAALPRVVNRASPRGLGGAVRGAAEWLLLAGRAGLPARGMRFATSARSFPKPGFDPHIPLDGAGLAAGAVVRSTSRATLGKAPAHFLEPVGGECRRVLVIGAHAHGGDLTPALRDGCLRLAREAGCALAEFWFARAGDGAGADAGWQFCGGSSFPADLPETETGALVALLEAGVEG
ncbi:MAG: hypothetical protein LC774_02615 [Acidobacteria bacterium]|nr:hypothetical protein [Acidobacteriota bacterium]